MDRQKTRIPVVVCLLPILFLIAVLSVTIILYKQSPHIGLLLSTAFAALIAIIFHRTWKCVQDGMTQGIQIALGAVLILVVVGTMIGTWIISGIVPSMIYYGLKVFSPGAFLVSTFVITSIISLGTGSSWSTASTIGVALVGVGSGLGIPPPMTVGAIIGGAYFGDKMSPLSDTTNLAPAVAGTDVFSHVRHMIYTTAPAYVIASALYIILGLQFKGGHINVESIRDILGTLENHFFIHPLLLLPPLLIIVMVILKIPPLPALFGGSVLGAVLAGLCQSRSLREIFLAAKSGFVSRTQMPFVDNLLTRGGMDSVLQTVALIVCALAFGGIMEKSGMLQILAEFFLKKIHSTGSLVAATVLSCIGMNVIVAEQYTAIVIPGRMFKKAFDMQRLHPKNLSRCLEDSVTVTSALIPWSCCGAFMHATLGVSPLVFAPFAFFNLLSPMISIVYGYTGITMEKVAAPLSRESDLNVEKG